MGSADNITQGYIYDDSLIPMLSVGDLLDNKIVPGFGLQGDGCIGSFTSILLSLSDASLQYD